MDTGRTDQIRTITFIYTIGIIITVEAVVGQLPATPLMRTGMARCLQIIVILLFFKRTAGGLASIGLSKQRLLPGFKKGLIWSAGFAGLAALAGGVLFALGINPFRLFHAGLPASASEIILFYVIGGFIAPIAEEIFFRGVVYGYLRGLLNRSLGKGSIVGAMVLSTSLFVAAHQGGTGIPLPQLVGGIVFCLSYEIEKSLVTPVIIHSTGNLALFSLSLIQF